MRIYIDADGCPVVRETIAIAERYNVPVTLVADTSHIFDMDNEAVELIVVSKGQDSSDFAILSKCGMGDIVVTQDYALASLCLTKGASPINQNGRLYTDENIDALLMNRYINRQIRSAGGKAGHTKKRIKAQNDAFKAALIELIGKLSLTK